MTDHDLAYRLLSDMVRVRRMEEKCAELYGESQDSRLPPSLCR